MKNKILYGKLCNNRITINSDNYFENNELLIALDGKSIKFLKELGFVTNINLNGLAKNSTDIINYVKELNKKRPELPYAIDGLVIKVDSLDNERFHQHYLTLNQYISSIIRVSHTNQILSVFILTITLYHRIWYDSFFLLKK